MSQPQAENSEASEDLTGAMGNLPHQQKVDQDDGNSDLKENGSLEVEANQNPEDGQEPGKLFDQESANKAFIKNKQKLRAEQDENARINAELDEAKRKLAESSQTVKPVIPPMPDQFDDDFNDKIKARDEAVIKLGEFNRDEALRVQTTQNAQAQQILDQQAQQQQTIKTFQERATTLGVDEKELVDAENIVGAYIRSPEVAQYLLGDENGPIVVPHLAKNPMELEKISKMSPMQAAVYISTSIMPAALKAKPGTTQTPDPAPIQNGGGTPKGIHPANVGATFE